MKTEISTRGVGFFGLMFLLFLGLKLGGIIQWHWLWVFAPLWVPVVAVLVIIVILLIVGAIIGTKIDDEES